MSYEIRPFFYGDEDGFLKVLKDYLFRINLKKAQVIQSPQELILEILQGCWPIVFIGETPDGKDAFENFELFFKTLGLQLIPFVLIAPPESKKYTLYAESMGAWGYLQKPLQPNAIAPLLKKVIPPENNNTIDFALKITRNVCSQNTSHMIEAVQKLENIQLFKKYIPYFKIRLHTHQKEHHLALKIIQQQLETSQGQSIRDFCEAIDFHKNLGLYHQCFAYYKNIENFKWIHHRIWEEIKLYLLLEKWEEACLLLPPFFEKEEYKEKCYDILTHLMYSFGLQEWIPEILNPYPQLMRLYDSFLKNKIRQHLKKI